MQEPSTKDAKSSQFLHRSARIALWLIPLMVAIYLFYQANRLAKTAGCQLGETCMTGDGATATYFAFAAFAVFIGFTISLLIFFTWKTLKFITTKIHKKPNNVLN